MADQATSLKRIADQVQVTHEQLRRGAANISVLLQAGRATCDVVKAYNLWALAIWNTQRGMLASLRAGGEANVPNDPPTPTLFTFKGVAGAQAFQLDCSGQAKSLNGLMAAAMAPPNAKTVYLSTNEIQMTTNDPFAANPEASPTFAQLVELQQTRGQLNAIPAIVIIIGIAAVSVSIAIAAIMKFLEVNSVQEANTEQTAIQATAFANYTGALSECFKRCTDESCIETCSKSVEKPDIEIPGMNKPWGTFQWIGLTVVVGVGAMAAWKIWERKKAGRPVFELPEFAGE